MLQVLLNRNSQSCCVLCSISFIFIKSSRLIALWAAADNLPTINHYRPQQVYLKMVSCQPVIILGPLVFLIKICIVWFPITMKSVIILMIVWAVEVGQKQDISAMFFFWSLCYNQFTQVVWPNIVFYQKSGNSTKQLMCYKQQTIQDGSLHENTNYLLSFSFSRWISLESLVSQSCFFVVYRSEVSTTGPSSQIKRGEEVFIVTTVHPPQPQALINVFSSNAE